MKKKLLFLIVFVCCIGMHNLKAQYTEWGFSMTSGNSNVYGLDSDTNGNIYTTGHYYSGIVLGANHSGSGVYLAKYDKDGNPIWSSVAGNGNSRGLAIATDQQGNSFVGGYFQTSITFGTGGTSQTLNTRQYYRAGFIAKFDSSGNFVWAQKLGGDGNYEEINEVVVDQTGNLYVAGVVGDVAYLAKHQGSNGQVIWSRNDVEFTDISTDGTHVYAVGTFYGTMELDGESIVSESGSSNIFYTKLSGGSGQVTFLKKAQIRTSNKVRLANDGQGNGYITGYSFYDDSVFAGTPIAVTNSNDNIFVAKFDNSGSEIWFKQANGLGNPPPFVADIVADNHGVYTTGYFHTKLTFDGGAEVTGKNTVVKLFKSFLTKYTTTGNLSWVKASSGISGDYPFRVTTNGKGKVTIAGRTQGRASFECVDLRSSALWGFNVRYHDASHPLAGSIPVGAGQKPLPANPITGNQNICAGENGVTYTTAPIPNVSSYKWTLPTGATIVSGNNTNTITVNFSQNAMSGTIEVAGVNQYCESTPATLNVNIRKKPRGNALISGPLQVTPGQTQVNYTLQSLSDATSYQWVLPQGVTPSNGTTTTTSNSISLNFPSSSGTGVISVKGVNNCGGSDVFSLQVVYSAFTVKGKVISENNNAIEGVTVLLTSTSSNTNQQTNNTGTYEFNGLQEGNYSLVPEKNNATSSCLEFFDYIALINYTNGGNNLNSPYKIIAADVDQSDTIDGADVNLLFQALNGITSLSKKWRFVPADYSFPNLNNPFGQVFPEKIEFNPLNQDQLNQNFIGIMIGDLNDCN
ncbi:carboxypeptidase regulatory-like domain-containing protein [Tenacibaculum xiamenense]|uniref:carboxypeptidase regulatory-like domain-containing protein n=1 Tax=Tenacibaculum xiamenense TaxID=1261553 RepID=UPI0038933F2F